MNNRFDETEPTCRGRWRRKFGFAFSGLGESCRDQSSFWVHLPIAAVVLSAAAWLQVDSWRWCILLLTTATVIAAELFNTALEHLVAVLHPHHDRRIASSLDAAAAAVLVLAITSVVIGLITLGGPLVSEITGPG